MGWEWNQEQARDGLGMRPGMGQGWAGSGARYLNHALFLNSFSVKAGSVADGVCGLSGHSLVFGMSQPIADFESRIGVTPPLDLRPCAEESKPACEFLW